MRSKEEIRQYNKQYRKDHVKELRKYREEHFEDRRQYQLKYRKDHIEKRRKYDEERSEVMKIRWKERAEEFRKWKGLAGPCVKCGNSDARVLQFHHPEPDKKEFEIGTHEWYVKSLISLIEELTKCIVLCANCHIIEGLKQRQK